MTSPEKDRVDAYMDTVSRIEPDIAMLDTGAALASIAISLRRIADALTVPKNRYGESVTEALAQLPVILREQP